MERSVFEIVKAPLGWSVFADNVKIGGVYDLRGAALEAATLAASYTISDGGRRSDQRARRGGRKAAMGRRIRYREFHSAHAERARAKRLTVKPV